LRFASLQNRYKTRHRDASKAPQKPHFPDTADFRHPVLRACAGPLPKHAIAAGFGSGVAVFGGGSENQVKLV
jgi:hypothetical protein